MMELRRWPIVDDPDLGPFEIFGGGTNPRTDRFAGDFRSTADLTRVSERISVSTADRLRTCAALDAFHRDFGADDAALENIAALRDPRTLVVATGQQPGLLGGPLYTAYKALTAVKLARQWTQRLGRRVVPVFWIAADDHDIHEVDSAALLTASLELAKFRADLGAFGPPIADLVVREPVRDVARNFLAACLGSEFDDAVAAPLLPVADERWPRWFARVLAAMMRTTGLVLADPTALRDSIAPLLDAEAADPARSPAALALGAEALARAGAEPPLDPAVRSCLFVTLQGRRQRFDPTKHSAVDIDRARRTSNSGLSADAALRTVVQSRLFPVLAVVGGPGELHYWAQLKELFDLHGTAMPLFVPRFRSTLLWPAIRKHLDALGLPESRWLDPESEALTQLRAVETPGSSEWARKKAAVTEAFERLAETLGPLGGSVPARVDQARAGLEQSLHRLLEVAAAREREATGASEKRRRAIATALRPLGKPQERVIASLSIALRFGPDFFSRLAESLDTEELRASYVELRYGSTS